MSSLNKNFLGLVLFLGTFCLYGQVGHVQREVYYETSTVRTFRVACHVDVNTLVSGIDWVYLQAKPANISQTRFMIVDNWLSVIKTYSQMPRYDRDYEFQTGKSVTDAWRTRLYTHAGAEYHYLPNDVPNDDFMLEPGVIANYGFFNNLFYVSIDDIEMYCNSAGVPIYIWGQKVLVTHSEIVGAGTEERVEIETDFDGLYYEMRLFTDNVHTRTERVEYQQIMVGGDIFPLQETHVYYNELPSGILYQITEIETYLSYQVIDDVGNTLVDWVNPSAAPAPVQDEVGIYTDPAPAAITVQVLPNPATDDIKIVFPMAIDAMMTVKITNMIGQTWINDNMFVTGNELPIDIQSLPAGLYYIVCTNKDGTARIKFLKEK